MKALYSICVASLLSALIPIGASGQSPSTDINPALLYYQAFLVAPDMSEADHDYLVYNEWEGQQLPDRFGQLMAGYDNEFRLLRQAVRSTAPCDWGIDMSDGPATLLPHLARTKAAVLTARLRALWFLQLGRQAEARDDLLAAFVLGRNVSRDGTLISTLVQGATAALTCDNVAALFGRFSTDNLQQLLDGIEAAPPPRLAAECVATERAFFQNWTLRKIQELQQANPGNDAQVMAGIHELLANALSLGEGVQEPQPSQTRMAGSGRLAQAGSLRDGQSEPGDWWTRLAQAAGGTSEGVVKLIRDLDSFEQKLAAILALPHGEFENQMALFKGELQYSPNPVPALLLPSWQHARARELRAMAALGMVHVAVEYKLHGPAGLQTVTDPWGQGPFGFRRFAFQGVDRGFELKSAYPLNSWPEVRIFVEKDGPPFRVCGKLAGQARPRTYPKLP
jgi:hypothetical protein